ncbi:hypothetical protein C7N43_18165 [Sphingobacteriales bacterium UPWRP_1]|nr:hypothetical protein C7N43_18165 [Sphingobacteriales bacterium UPWRP_1]
MFRSLLVAVLALVSFALFAQNDYDVQYYRPYDQRGVNMFETPKTTWNDNNGFKVRIGGSFTQQFQFLSQESGIPDTLKEIKPGFNLATANLNIDAQLYDGISLSLVTYLSSRHHSEAWVKGGYLQFDKLAFLKSSFADKLMENLTIKVGHFEINYGDAHFRRTDNGNAMWNPFVGEYILDAFTTEIGGEVIYQPKFGLVGVLAVTGGEIKGDVIKPTVVATDDKSKRSPSVIAKLGYDKQINDKFRARVTGSMYYTASSQSNTLYGGDRTGSRYYNVLLLETVTDLNGAAFTGRFNPGFRDKVTAFMGNVFLKYSGAEIFATYEMANGRASTETDTRNVSQFAIDGLYRFGNREQFHIGARYNMVNAEYLNGAAGVVDVSLDRLQIAAGAYITKNILAKVEYVNQNYNDFPNNPGTSQIQLYNAKFNGVMIEGVVGF